jgi:hypothetical protein
MLSMEQRKELWAALKEKLDSNTFKEESKEYYAFVKKNRGQHGCPLLEIASTDCPDPLHNDTNGAKHWMRFVISSAIERSVIVKTVKARFLKVISKCGLSVLLGELDRIWDLPDEKRTAFEFRLIGRQAISAMKNARTITNVLKWDGEPSHLKKKRNILFLIGMTLALSSELYNKRKVSPEELNHLEKYCRVYWVLNNMLTPDQMRGGKIIRQIPPTVYTIGVLIPWYSKNLSQKYGFGLGTMSLQAPESKHKIIHKLLELTNKRDHNKWKTVLQNDYLLSFFLPSKKFPVGEEHSDNSWTPRVCRLDGHCPCGNRHGSGRVININSNIHSAKENESFPYYLDSNLCSECLETVGLFKDALLMEYKESTNTPSKMERKRTLDQL